MLRGRAGHGMRRGNRWARRAGGKPPERLAEGLLLCMVLGICRPLQHSSELLPLPGGEPAGPGLEGTGGILEATGGRATRHSGCVSWRGAMRRGLTWLNFP